MNQQQLKQRCRKHWNEVGITDEKSLKDHIKTIFERHNNQSDILIDIYKLALPDWDQIEMIDHSPEAGQDLWEFICKQFIDFDRRNHPEVFNGGIWLNNGFSSKGNVNPWEISFENCRVTMK